MESKSSQYLDSNNINNNLKDIPHHHKIYSEPYITTNTKQFSIHRIKIYPNEEKKLNFYPLIIKKKRIHNSNDLFSKIRGNNQYQVYSQKDIERNNNLHKQKSRNFKLITESSTDFKLPPIKQSQYNPIPTVNKTKHRHNKRSKPIDILGDDYFKTERLNLNQMVGTVLTKETQPKCHYLFPPEYEKIKINDTIKLYKNKLTIPTQESERTEDNDEECKVKQIRSQRYRNTIIKPPRLSQMPQPKKIVIPTDEKNKEIKLKQINDTFIQQYKKDAKKLVRNEIDNAICTKEILSNSIDLVLKRDAEEFNKMVFDSVDE